MFISHAVLRLRRHCLYCDSLEKANVWLLWFSNQHKQIWVDSGPGTLHAQPQSGPGDSPGTLRVALCKKGQLGIAIAGMASLAQDTAVPGAETFAHLLKSCGKKKALPQAKQLRIQLAKHGLDSTRFLGEYMVSTLVKCGGLDDALQAFKGLPRRTVFSWTSIISGYSTSGQVQEALRMYWRMREEGVVPNTYTFVSVLKACGIIADLEQGRRIHVEAVKHGCEANVFVGACLVTMYAKCGSITDAIYVFNRLSERNVVSWTAILSAYIQQGQAEKFLHLYGQMHEEGVSPDGRTFIVLLQACAMLADKETDFSANKRRLSKYMGMGKAIQAEVWRRGHQCDVFIVSTLVTMYSQCGSIVDAKAVFDQLSEQNVVAWTSMLSAYAHESLVDEAWQAYGQMQEEGVSPDPRTSVVMLQVCGSLAERDQGVSKGQFIKWKHLGKGKTMHAYASLRGYVSDAFVSNTLISMYSKCGSIHDVQIVFDSLHHYGIISWNAVMAAHIDQGQAENALELYEKLFEECVSPDVRTFVCALQICGLLAEEEESVMMDGQTTKAKCVEMGKAIHACIKMKGFDSDAFVNHTLISLYGKLGSIADAWNVFHGLSHLNVVSWNAMLAAYAQQGLADKAIELYNHMLLTGVDLDEITLVCILHASSNAGRLDICRQVHGSLASLGYGSNHLLVNTLIHAYGKCGGMADAQNVFDALQQPDLASWTALIAGYARQGNFAASLRQYEEMQVAKVEPDGVTFLSLLSACSHAGLVDKGLEYFEFMSARHGITPEIEHYVCLIDLLGRAGCFTKIEELLLTMPMKPNLCMWLCLLSACRKHGKLVLGRRAFDHAVCLEPKHVAAYVLMSSMYADAGLLVSAKEVNAMEEAAGGWDKPSGRSWMEYEHGLLNFMVEDREHLNQVELYDFLQLVSQRIGVLAYQKWGN